MHLILFQLPFQSRNKPWNSKQYSTGLSLPPFPDFTLLILVVTKTKVNKGKGIETVIDTNSQNVSFFFCCNLLYIKHEKERQKNKQRARNRFLMLVEAAASQALYISIYSITFTNGIIFLYSIDLSIFYLPLHMKHLKHVNLCLCEIDLC